MNYKNMSLEEIVRVAVPVTDLEIALIEKIDLDRPGDDEYERILQAASDEEDKVSELNDDIKDLCHGITMALASIAEGNIDKARTILEAL